jgi:hypothetical protein
MHARGLLREWQVTAQPKRLNSSYCAAAGSFTITSRWSVEATATSVPSGE